ncbi:hypothetical protein SAMN04487820_104275 [Actinopolyspora mzabensis]|uniref:ABC transporter n=1 Tax=Actinopolyspora mzabensis TaxID=995066 RepID=A0A1G8Z8A5_ACTMZ|nr:hypothetical protein [Actinopolyspora mzabensis]SDK10854.1 hypothetical protein SAMN04487820_104275 [Actinopolyspora mzabensis]
MEIVAAGAGVTGPHGTLLEPTSLRASSGELRLVSGPPRSGRTALALLLAGRLRPDSGTVLRNGRRAPAELRGTVAVVDAPGVTEPEGSVELREVVAEGLGIAGRRFGGQAVRDWLAERGLRQQANLRFERVPPHCRTRLLLDLAREARGVEALVLDCPDRHGGEAISWYGAAQEAASQGYAVVALCSPHTAIELDHIPARIGTDNDLPPSPRRTDQPTDSDLSTDSVANVDPGSF